MVRGDLGMEPEAGEETGLERGLLITYLAIRAVHVTQGLICVLSGWSTYRRPKLAAVTLVVCASETGWLIHRCVPGGRAEPTAVRVDVATGVVGLLAMARAMDPADRTTSMNWVMPYTVGSAAGLSMGFGAGAEGIGSISALAATYLATARGEKGSTQRTTAVANAASYVGFFTVAESVTRAVRRASRSLAAARAEAATRGEQLLREQHRLTVERERNRQNRLIHDSALQTLDVVAAGLHDDPGPVQAQARVEATRLRRALAGTEAARGLSQGMHGLVDEAGELGLHCTFTASVTAEPTDDATEALVEATREALRNITKHAEVTTAVIRAVDHAAGIQVTVRDQGVGFDLDQTGTGFGLRQSIDARLADVGGSATIWSEPGRGTRVTLWVPR